MNNKEIDYEGWLVKSPPSKRIWRARWRRRWFTLKQGEIPGQFCLEYYTDQSCRKLKGVIDLDQCEQVDSGLHLEHRKQNFQYMFDIKTPRRTYYLAADTEADMICWVNCICQVCNLHDFTKPSNPERPYYNVLQGDGPFQELPLPPSIINSSNETTSTSLNNSSLFNHNQSNISSTKQPPSIEQQQSDVSDLIQETDDISITNAYQNSNDEFPYVNTDYTNRETVVFDSLMIDYVKGQSNNIQNTQIQQHNPHQIIKSNKSIINTSSIDENDIELRENGVDKIETVTDKSSEQIIPSHNFSINNQQITNTISNSRTVISSSGVIKKIPENLVLNMTSFMENSNVEPSPALSTSSGPYIPISECFSGSPKFLNDSSSYVGDNPTTPLNNLDPKFYETPKSRIQNIGLNLTNDQSYSPKITNFSQIAIRPRSGQYSPTDSESGFTDEDDWTHADRITKPSDNATENESLVFTYAQRFSKLPDDGGNDEQQNGNNSISKGKLGKNQKRKNRLLLGSKSEDERIIREFPQLSDTENTSPAIGLHDGSSWIKENVNNLQYCNMNQLKDIAVTQENPIAASTPNLVGSSGSIIGLTTDQSRTMPRSTKIQGNVFTFPDKPPVYRQLKPKATFEDKAPAELPAKPPTTSKPLTILENSIIKPPSIDRKLKPASKGCDSPKLSILNRRSSGNPRSICISSIDLNNINHKDLQTRTLPRTSTFSTPNSNNNTNPIYNNSNSNFVTRSNTISALAGTTLTGNTPTIQNQHQLEYTDLDFESNPTPIPNIRKNSIGSASICSSKSILGSGISLNSTATTQQSGVIYSIVDRVKTEAVKQMCEDVQKTRRKN